MKNKKKENSRNVIIQVVQVHPILIPNVFKYFIKISKLNLIVSLNILKSLMGLKKIKKNG